MMTRDPRSDPQLGDYPRGAGKARRVIFRILFVEFEIVLRDIYDLCSEEDVPDPN